MIKQGKLDIKLHKEEGYQFTTEDVQQAHKVRLSLGPVWWILSKQFTRTYLVVEQQASSSSRSLELV